MKSRILTIEFVSLRSIPRPERNAVRAHERDRLIEAAQAIKAQKPLSLRDLPPDSGHPRLIPMRFYIKAIVMRFADPSAVALGCQARPLLNFR